VITKRKKQTKEENSPKKIDVLASLLKYNECENISLNLL
jgi:hypothetical protein